jgi:outer membrane protein TolC
VRTRNAERERRPLERGGSPTHRPATIPFLLLAPLPLWTRPSHIARPDAVHRATPRSPQPFAHTLRNFLAAVLALTFTAACLAGHDDDDVQRIDLATTLRLAGANNLDIQLARARLAEAEANELSAIQQFFPYVSPGLSYRRHEGNIQNVEGLIIDADKELFTAGASVQAQVEVGEAIFRTLAARQLRDAARYGAGAQQQEVIYQAALAYLELARAEAASGVAAQSVEISHDIGTQVARAAEAGLAFKGDVYRTNAQTQRNRLTLAQAREQQRLAAARLATILRLDPTINLRAAGGGMTLLRLVPLSRSLDVLVGEALAARPDLGVASAQLRAARKSRQGAIYGPLIPSVNAQAYYGGLGGGIGNPGPREFDQSSDYSASLGWRIGPGGLLDLGRVRAHDARVHQGELELEKARDIVTRDVVEGHTRIHSLSGQLNAAREALAAAEQSLRLARERSAFGVGEVLETIQAEQDLTRARLDYVGVVAEHNKAQYALQRARGALAPATARPRGK